MLELFGDIAGFSPENSYYFWAGVLSFFAIVLAIATCISAYKLMGDEEIAQEDVVMIVLRALTVLIMIAWLVQP